ncbi:Imm7 family immunity protein [uncultured Kiloniella sp.]|uniref:Imm7 family immunity protein n=1 Tax=uncultured Kiloniella sp. TaxID=1133091 RepID=UPI0034592389
MIWYLCNTATIDKFKGAYGLIYEFDGQREVEIGRGVFSVSVIKRGACEKRLDPFLSPTIPVVEDY